MTIPGSDRYGSFAGVPVYWHGTLILIPLFLGMQFQRFGLLAGGLLAVVLTCLVVGSILLHEAAHVRAARRFGVGARAIVLHGFGGFALIDAVPMRPARRILIALAGPLANLALALAGYVLLKSAEFVLVPAASERVGAFGLTLPPLARSLAGNAVLSGLKTFAMLNLLLGLVNLMPAFPLDGGMVVRTLAGLRFSPRTAVRVTGPRPRLHSRRRPSRRPCRLRHVDRWSRRLRPGSSASRRKWLGAMAARHLLDRRTRLELGVISGPRLCRTAVRARGRNR